MKVDPKSLVVHIPDTRGVTVSPYGKGNMKIGMGVYTYSRMPGLPDALALGVEGLNRIDKGASLNGTCPGATAECMRMCYAARPMTERGIVSNMWFRNSQTEDVPPVPDDCTELRIHVSGDFTSYDYIRNWIDRLVARPDVTAWAYTRSWRVPGLLPALEALRALPNVQLFASMDTSTEEMPPLGWRRAWISGDTRLHPLTDRLDAVIDSRLLDDDLSSDPPTEEEMRAATTPSYACPEQTGHRQNCTQCGYCQRGQKHDVTFLEH